MSTVTPIINTQLDTLNGHMAELINKINHQNAAFDMMVADKRAEMLTDAAELAALIQHGELLEVMDYGDQATFEWVDHSPSTPTTYQAEFDLTHLETAVLEDQEQVPVGVFQMHYTLPYGLAFDAAEAIFESDAVLPAGTYHFTVANDSWGGNNGKTYQFVLPEDLPAGYQIRKSVGYNVLLTNGTLDVYESGASLTKLYSMTPSEGSGGTDLGITNGSGDLNHWHRVALGYNRWKTSALRQQLNADAAKGAWWTPQNKWDVKPSAADTTAGFLYGLPASVKAHLKAAKVVTARNNIDGTDLDPDITYDKVFIPALEQMYIQAQKTGEGEYWEYYKRLLGATSPVARSQTYPRLISYAINSKTSAQYVWLRSASVSNANYEWHVHTSGYVYGTHANYTYRIRPCLRIG